MRILWSCLLLLVLLTGCKEVLYSNLTQREANKLVTTLRQSGIDAERIETGGDTFSVLVATDKFAESMTLLERRGLPQDRFDTMADVFASDSLLPTPLEERARLAYALSQEMMGSLTAVDGILDAHVHLTLSKDLPLSNEATPATASVLLTYAPDFDVEGFIPDVKFLVAQGVPNLSYRDVSVVTVPARQWDQTDDNAGFSHSSFLGIRIVDEDTGKFAVLILFLAAALAALLAAIAFVIFRSGTTSEEGAPSAEAVRSASQASGLQRLIWRWTGRRAVS